MQRGAAILMLAASCASAAPPTMAIYGGSAATPYARTYSGGVWQSQQTLPSVGSGPMWLVAKGCPTRDEVCAAVVNGSSSLRTLVHTGGAWTAASVISSSVGSDNERRFDFAYETTSGDGLIAYWDEGTNRVAFRTFNGTTWSSQSTLASTIDEARCLALYSAPNSDVIVMLVVTNSAKIFGVRWSGTAWGTITTLTTSAASIDTECFGFAFEQGTGRGIAAYGGSGNNVLYRTLTGTTWSSQLTGPNVGGKPLFVRLAAQPGGDRMLLGALTDQEDVVVASWSGSAWSATTTATSSSTSKVSRHFDVAFQPDGQKGLVAYGVSGSTAPRYRVWTSAGGFAPEQSLASIGDAIRIVQIAPGTAGSTHMLVSDQFEDLSAFLWNGTSFSSATQLTGSLGSFDEYEQFMMVAPGGSTPVAPSIDITRWREISAEEQ
jgi:hypothetical protein